MPRSSFKDFLSPATEKAWQGVPPHKNSGASIAPVLMSVGSFLRSPKFGISGNRSFSTALGNFSISENHTAFQPRGLKATEAASIPLQTEPNFIFTPV